MPKTLSLHQIESFQQNGFIFPIRVLNAAEAADYVGRLHTFESAHPEMSRDQVHHKLLRFKPHLLLTWLNQLTRHPQILDAVEDLIGPDILCWSSAFFVKDPFDPGYISWHQDSITYGLEGGPLVTAWIALTDVHSDNGAMRFARGSHQQGLQSHTDTWAKDNRLSRGETVNLEIDDSQAVEVNLDAGQMSLHHIDLVHSSPANPSGRPRIGYAIRYFPPYLTHPSGPESALLVRGEDRFHHFDLESSPVQGQEAASRAAYTRAMQLRSRSTFQKAQNDRVFLDS